MILKDSFNDITVNRICNELGCHNPTHSYIYHNKLYCIGCPNIKSKICCHFCTAKKDCVPEEHFNSMDEVVKFLIFKKLDKSK